MKIQIKQKKKKKSEKRQGALANETTRSLTMEKSIKRERETLWNRDEAWKMRRDAFNTSREAKNSERKSIHESDSSATDIVTLLLILFLLFQP